MDTRRVWIGSAPPLADGFIDRAKPAQQVSAALVPGATVALVSGRITRGTKARDWSDSCGKTQLAVAMARSLWAAGAVDVLIWITATSRASVLSAYVEASTQVRDGHLDVATTPAREDAESLGAGFVTWLRETTRPWLVVLDDLTDAGNMDQLWPEGPAGRVLVTATDLGAVPSGPEKLVVPVVTFSRREALTYLMDRLTRDPDQRQGAIDLVSDLDDEPVALGHASAMIASSELTCRDYREHFLDRRQQATAMSGTQPPSSAITWALAVEHADVLAPGAGQPALAIAALLDGNGIPGTVFTASAARKYVSRRPGDDAGGDPLAALEQTGLLSVDDGTAPPTVRMLWPVQAALRAAMPDSMFGGAAQAAADALLEAWPHDERPEWLVRSLRSCADSLRQTAGDLLWRAGSPELLLHAGRSLDAARLTGPAADFWEDLVARSERLLGHDHPDTRALRERLARAHLAAGRTAESIPWFQRVLQDRTSSLGRDHPGTLEAGRDLGRALAAAGQFGAATAVLADVAGGYEHSLGPAGAETLAVRDELAAAYRADGRFADAAVLYSRVLADRERVQGPRHADTLRTRQNLAEAYLADGQDKKAIPYYKRALADRERVLGAGHPDTMVTRAALGRAYESAGNLAAALQLYEQVSADYATVLGEDNRLTLQACVNLARAYYSVGRLTDATRLLHDTAKRCERSLPPSDPLWRAVRESLTDITGGIDMS